MSAHRCGLKALLTLAIVVSLADASAYFIFLEYILGDSPSCFCFSIGLDRESQAYLDKIAALNCLNNRFKVNVFYKPWCS